METSNNTTKLAQHKRNKSQYNEIRTTQWKQAATQRKIIIIIFLVGETSGLKFYLISP